MINMIFNGFLLMVGAGLAWLGLTVIVHVFLIISSNREG
jgi:hypothetical protein